jgi:hypothetical protein
MTLFNGSDQLHTLIVLLHRRAPALSTEQGLGGPKNQSEGLREEKNPLAPVWNRTTVSWLSSHLSNPHNEFTSQTVSTSLRPILILYFYLLLGLQNNTFRSELLAENLDAFLLHSNMMCAT